MWEDHLILILFACSFSATVWEAQGFSRLLERSTGELQYIVLFLCAIMYSGAHNLITNYGK